LFSLMDDKIPIYEFPECEEGEQGKLQKMYRERVPFAVIGSNHVVEVDGTRKRARRFPWGVTEVENLAHNDFTALRKMLLSYYMLHMVEETESRLYENFRYKRLHTLQNGGSVSTPSQLSDQKSMKNPLAEMEQEKMAQEAKLKEMEKDMYDVFLAKTQEKEAKMRELQAEMERKYQQQVNQLAEQKRRLAMEREEFVKKRDAFDLVEKQLLESRNATVDSRDGLDGKKDKKKKSIF